MPQPLGLNGVISIGAKTLHVSRRALTRDLGEQAPACLQEIGYAAGEDLYTGFCAWLPGYTGVDDPTDLDASTLGEVLSTFFQSTGWGTVGIENLGTSGMAITSTDWAEAEVGANTDYPSCHFSSGLLADFLTRLAGGQTVAIMEVECRSRNDERCRFFAGAPKTLEAVYNAMTEGEDYEAVFSG